MIFLFLMISVLCVNPSSAESSHDQIINIQLFVRSFVPSFIHSFIHSFISSSIHPSTPSFLPLSYAFINSLDQYNHSFIHSSPVPFIHLLLPSFPYFMHLLIHLINIIIQSFFHSIGLITRLSISICKCDHPGMLSGEKQKTQKVIQGVQKSSFL